MTDRSAGPYEDGLNVGSVSEGSSRIYILVPLIIVLLPALVEFGYMLNATLALKAAAGEAASAAAAGAAPAVIETKVEACRDGVDGRFVQCTALSSERDGAAGLWSPWRRLGMAAGENDADCGDRVQIRLQYDYPLVLGGLLAPVFRADGDNTVDLEAVAEAVRG